MMETQIQVRRHSLDEDKTMTDMDEKEQDAKKRNWSRQWSILSIVSRDSIVGLDSAESVAGLDSAESVGSLESAEGIANQHVEGEQNSFMKELCLHPYFPYWPIPVFFIMVIFLMIVFSISGFFFY